MLVWNFSDIDSYVENNGVQGITPLHNAKTAKDCKELIMQGNDVNAVDSEGQTPLHHAILKKRGVEVVKELLRGGASVSARDNHECTPLLAAVQVFDRSLILIVKELLQHGASPNILDHEGYSLLTRALHTNDFFLVKELLEWDADINIQNRVLINCFLTPMSEAVTRDDECAKMFIRITVLKYFDDNYEDVLNLNRFRNRRNFVKLSSYMEECACELHEMKYYMIDDRYSLFQCLTNSRKFCKPLYWDYYSCNNFFREAKTYFPIYEHVIFENMANYLVRGEHFSELRDHQLQIRASDDGREVSLNTDCCFKIAEYLSNDELSAFIEALK